MKTPLDVSLAESRRQNQERPRLHRHLSPHPSPHLSEEEEQLDDNCVEWLPYRCSSPVTAQRFHTPAPVHKEQDEKENEKKDMKDKNDEKDEGDSWCLRSGLIPTQKKDIAEVSASLIDTGLLWVTVAG